MPCDRSSGDAAAGVGAGAGELSFPMPTPTATPMFTSASQQALKLLSKDSLFGERQGSIVFSPIFQFHADPQPQAGTDFEVLLANFPWYMQHSHHSYTCHAL